MSASKTMNDLAKALRRPEYEPFIRHIRFPRFKNIAAKSKLEFTHPITVLTGPNGTNKSSILRALQACPKGHDISDFWFETDLDKIEGGEAQRYIHGYRLPSRRMAEVIKTRVFRTDRGGGEYFETRAPRIDDDMEEMPKIGNMSPKDLPYRSSTRWGPVRMKVVYLDFRQEIPAFDILFHFNWRNKENGFDKKKSLARRESGHVAEALNRLLKTKVYYTKERILSPAEELTKEELHQVSEILGRKYVDIRLVKHDFFGVEGYTALIKTEHLGYSEAFAGSGEFAAIMLVRAISQAEKHSLILLDEPETSLHPKAQHALLNFLAHESLQKSLQIVISSHSPSIVTNLLPESVKLLDINPRSGQVEVVANKASPREAFNRIGGDYVSQSIIVEDELAKAFIMRAARISGTDLPSLLQIDIVPGGSEVILGRVAPTVQLVAPTCMVYVDGDQRPNIEMPDPRNVADSELDRLLGEYKIREKMLCSNSGDSSNIEIMTARKSTLYAWCHSNIRFLPGLDPESLLLKLIGEKMEFSANQAKLRWVEKTCISLGLPPTGRPSSTEILVVQKQALATIQDSNAELLEILEVLQNFVARS